MDAYKLLEQRSYCFSMALPDLVFSKGFKKYLRKGIIGTKQLFCIALGQEFIIAIFNDEIVELQDCAMDAGEELWYIMGTDAWLELETGTKPALVARGYEKTYFTCFVSDEIAKKIVSI